MQKVSDLIPSFFLVGIALEAALFFFPGVIITQVAQGLRLEMLAYIKVLLINIDLFRQPRGILLPVAALFCLGN